MGHSFCHKAAASPRLMVAWENICRLGAKKQAVFFDPVLPGGRSSRYRDWRRSDGPLSADQREAISITRAMPVAACHSMWQWKNQRPGFDACH